MAGNLLSHRINTLLLNAKAPFPSEVRDHHQLVREWRHEQRLKLVRPERNDADRSTSDNAVPTLVGGEKP